MCEFSTISVNNLEKWFSNFSTHQNHPEGLVHTLLGLPAESLIYWITGKVMTFLTTQ